MFETFCISENLQPQIARTNANTVRLWAKHLAPVAFAVDILPSLKPGLPSSLHSYCH